MKFDTFVYNCPVCKKDTTSKIITMFGENKLLTIGDEFFNGEMNLKPCEHCKAINIVVAVDGKITEFKNNPRKIEQKPAQTSGQAVEDKPSDNPQGKEDMSGTEGTQNPILKGLIKSAQLKEALASIALDKGDYGTQTLEPDTQGYLETKLNKQENANAKSKKTSDTKSER